MKLILLIFAFGLASSEPVPSYFGFNYHERVGIRKAALIKAAEEATDFDGSRIVGGAAAVAGQFPFMAGLSITLRTGFTSVCGATLLSNTRALTAAHCWWDGRSQARQFIVILGTISFSTGTRVTTNIVQTHPKWDASSLENDVAVATFAWVTYTNNIKNIALPSGLFSTYDFIGFTADAVGYGIRTDTTTVTTAQPLHHVSLQVVSNNICQSLYGPKVVNTLICARGNDGRSTCDGDNGGPLVIYNGDQPILVS